MLKPLQKVYKLGASHSANMWGDVVNYCVSTIRETCGSEGTCPVADLLEWEIMRAWVCKLSTRKMVVNATKPQRVCLLTSSFLKWGRICEGVYLLP